MSSADNRWIISTHVFREHKTYAAMETELARLKAINPLRIFHVYRIKRTVLSSADTEQELVKPA